MTLSPTSRRLRWLAPAAVAALVAVAAFTSNVSAASGAPSLPPRTAADLLAAMQDANPAGMSGTIVKTAKLGLPTLPAGMDAHGEGANLSLQSLVSGSQTVRVWLAGETKQRIAVLGELSESNIVHNGTQLWTYTSTTHRVTHTTITQPAHVRETAKAVTGTTPQALAERALAAIDPTTSVEVDSTARVAGRAAYQLLVKPRDDRSLVGSIRLAVDAKTNVPLRVQVFAKAATKPAIEVGFTDVTFAMPEESVFSFVPPAGTTVVEEPLGATMLGRGRDRYSDRGSKPDRVQPDNVVAPAEQGAEADKPAENGYEVLGKGWTSVVVLPSDSALSGTAGGLIQRMAEPVPGGRLITSALISVFLSDNGKVYVGSVTGTDLAQVAATGRGL